MNHPRPFRQRDDQCDATCTTDCGHCKGSGLNREQRRRLSSKPGPGLVPVTVSRQVPMSVIIGADGAQETVQMDTAEPCYSCKCCALWSATVTTLRESMLEHEDGGHAVTVPGIPLSMMAELNDERASIFPGCLVCQLLAGAADG